MEKVERLNEAFKYLRSIGKIHTQIDLSNAMNANRVTISNALKDKGGYLNDDFLSRFSKSFDGIFNESWLLTGEGEMLNYVDQERKEKEIDISPSDIREGVYSGALVYNLDGTCGTAERDMIFTNDNVIGSISLPEINPSSKIVRANGDSMEPVIFDGDKVVLRQIYNFDEIFYGQIYLILLEEYRMIKYIRKYEPDEDNYIILRSRNQEYDDIKLHRSKIKKLFVVENILSVKTQL